MARVDSRTARCDVSSSADRSSVTALFLAAAFLLARALVGMADPGSDRQATAMRWRKEFQRDMARTVADLLEQPSDTSRVVSLTRASLGREAGRATGRQLNIDKELAGFVGLASVKSEVTMLAAQAVVFQTRRRQGLRVPDVSRHLVFVGNPGTGKTSIARILGRIYAEYGLLSKGHIQETSRADFVAPYMGQTAHKTTETFQKALGGVLFIDEAYSLTPDSGHSDYGSEAIDTLVKLMEDHRDDVVVIAAGYPREMTRFVTSNPGLQSRFKRALEFADYSNEELVKIVDGFCGEYGYRCENGFRAALLALFQGEPRGPQFGNARYARNIFETTLENQAQRLVGSPNLTSAQLQELRLCDLPILG